MPEKKLMNSTYLKCRSYLARVVSNIVPPQEIEDIVQETYVRICQFRPEQIADQPSGLIARIARNLALDHVKRAEWRFTDSHADVSEVRLGGPPHLSDETYQQVVSNEEFARFCDSVRQLPLQCRRVFVLKKVYGYSQREIALELNISESTVEKHVAKGMKQCMAYMQQKNESLFGRMEASSHLASGRGGHE